MALETWILVCGEKHALLDPVRVKSKIHQTVPRGRMSWGLAYLLSARLVSEMKDSNLSLQSKCIISHFFHEGSIWGRLHNIEYFRYQQCI